MNLEEYIEKINNNDFKKHKIEVLDCGKKVYFSVYRKKLYDVTSYIPEQNQIIHSCLENHINKKVKVIDFVSDFRGDSGDDGGFCFYVGEYKGRYVLGVNYISYNLNFSKVFIEVNELEEGDEGIEYVYFDTLEEIDNFIERMFNRVEEVKKESEEDEWYELMFEANEEDFESKFMFECISALGSAFCEYPEENTKLIKGMTSQKNYVPVIKEDPCEYYDSWIEDNPQFILGEVPDK